MDDPYNFKFIIQYPNGKYYVRDFDTVRHLFPPMIYKILKIVPWVIGKPDGYYLTKYGYINE